MRLAKTTRMKHERLLVVNDFNMSDLLDIKRSGYNKQRAASLGASITLVSGAGEYTALFECAKRCAEVLGASGMCDVGDGILESILKYAIETGELNVSLQKLSKRFSVALVEYVADKSGARFVPIWRIERSTVQATEELPPTPETITTASTNLDDY